MIVFYAVYALVLSAVYFVVALADKDLAQALTVLFVALVLVPEPFVRAKRRRA